MPTILDFGVDDPSLGIYGIYNDFYVRITNDVEAVKFKFKYVIEISVNGTTISEEIEVRAIDEVSVVQPFEILKDLWFKCQVVGLNGDLLDDPNSVEIAQFGLRKCEIRAGMLYADTADSQPTFRGFDSGVDIIRFYNGYENLNISNETVNYSNYMDVGWTGTGEIKLNHTILNRKIGATLDDENKVFAASHFKDENGDLVTLNAVVTDSYNSSGVLINQDIDPIAAGDLGYYVYNFPKTIPPTTGLERLEVYFRYTLNAGNVFSEKISFTSFECDKFERYRIRWFNRYGAFEYLNANGLFESSVSTSGGKEILTDGIDPTATEFGKIKTIARPALRNFGKTKEVTYSLSTNFLTREEQLGLAEIIESPNILLYDPENNIIPVICTDNRFKIIDVQQELVKYQLNFKSADQGKILRR